MSDNTWPRDQYTGPGGGGYTDLVGDYIQDQAEERTRVQMAGCTRVLVGECTLAQVEDYIQALEDVFTRDQVVDFIRDQMEVYTLAPVAASIAVLAAACTLVPPIRRIKVTYHLGMSSSITLKSTKCRI